MTTRLSNGFRLHSTNTHWVSIIIGSWESSANRTKILHTNSDILAEQTDNVQQTKYVGNYMSEGDKFYREKEKCRVRYEVYGSQGEERDTVLTRVIRVCLIKKLDI